MNYKQLIEEISQRRKEINFLQSQISLQNKELINFTKQVQKIETDFFKDWIELNTPIELTSYVKFPGIQVDIKSTPIVWGKNNIWSPNFSKGDTIEVIKKNVKSFIIKCTRRRVLENNKGVYLEKFINPESKFRIDIYDIQNYLLSNKETKERFQNWIIRNSALDSLLD